MKLRRVRLVLLSFKHLLYLSPVTIASTKKPKIMQVMIISVLFIQSFTIKISFLIVSPLRTLVQAWFSIFPWRSQAFPFHEPPGRKAIGMSSNTSFKGCLKIPFRTWWIVPSPPITAKSVKSIFFKFSKNSSMELGLVVTNFSYLIPVISSIGFNLFSNINSALRFPPIGFTKQSTFLYFPFYFSLLIWLSLSRQILNYSFEGKLKLNSLNLSSSSFMKNKEIVLPFNSKWIKSW